MITPFHSMHYVDGFGEVSCFSCMVDYQTEGSRIAKTAIFIVITKTFNRPTIKEMNT
jgi:hypothetical protein